MEIRRGEFLKGAAATAAVAGAGMCKAQTATKFTVPKGVKMRSALLHLGMSMWGGYLAPGEKRDPNLRYGRQACPTEQELWLEVTALMQKRKYNHVIIDLGGGVEFPSHPELTIPGARTPQQVRDEVARLAGMGIEAVPKLNFSACHDAWLGPYERMLSTPKYYKVVEDVIADACEMFGHPRHVHIGLDEEDGVHGAKDPIMVVRCGELWWHDFNFYLRTLERHGAQAIMFTGPRGRDPEEFDKRVPKSVIMNAGIYGSFESKEELIAKFAKRYATGSLKAKARRPFVFRELADHGFSILTCVSNWANAFGDEANAATTNDKSISCVQKYIASEVPDAQIAGGCVAPWRSMIANRRKVWLDAINQLADSCDALGW